MFFVNRVFFSKSTGKQSNSIQKFDEEIAAKKRFYNILAADIDGADIDYELVQIVREDGICIGSQVFDNREPEVTEPEGGEE